MSEQTAALRALVQGAQLSSVGFHELSGRQADSGGSTSDENLAIIPEYRLGILYDDGDPLQFSAPSL